MTPPESAKQFRCNIAIARHAGLAVPSAIAVIGIVVSALLMTSTACYGQLSGSDDATLQRIVVLWLDDDDEASLPALATLARAGNPAARLLLARIERYDRAPSAFQSSLSKQARLSLFRAPRNESGFYPTWLRVESIRGNKLASALERARLPYVDLQLIKTLYRAGEIQASDHPVRIASIYGDQRTHRVLLQSDYLIAELAPYVRSYRIPAQQQADGLEALRTIAAEVTSTGNSRIDITDEDTSQVARMLSLGYPFGEITVASRWRPIIENWLMTSMASRPVAALCERQCSDQSGDCAIAMLGLTGGYYELIRLDSPLESIISQEDFLDSPRARRSALQRAALTHSETAEELMSIAQIEKVSDCAAALVATVRDEHGY